MSTYLSGINQKRVRVISKETGSLYTLCAVAMWECFSYYGMKALLVLYMIKSMHFSDVNAFKILGGFGALVYLTPILGSFIGSRFIGIRNATLIGGVMMMLGHITLSLNHAHLLYWALAFLIIGSGLMKPNLVNLVGKIYPKDHPQYDNAFTAFYVGANLGSFVAPIACGFVSSYYGWHMGFLLAAIGMFLGLIVFVVGGFYWKIGTTDNIQMPNLRGIIRHSWLLLAFTLLLPVIVYLLKSNTYQWVLNSVSIVFFIGLFIYMIRKWQSTGKNMMVMLIVLLFGTIFWAFDQQAASSITLFTDRFTDRHLLGIDIPTPVFQSINPLVIILFGPLLCIIWRATRKMDWFTGPMQKFMLALFLAFAGFGVLSMSVHFSPNHHAISCLWVISAYVLISIGELCCEPIGLAAMSKLSSVQMVSIMISAWYLFTGAYSNYLASCIASLTAVDHTKLIGKVVENVLPYAHVFQEISLWALASALVLGMLSWMIRRDTMKYK